MLCLRLLVGWKPVGQLRKGLDRRTGGHDRQDQDAGGGRVKHDSRDRRDEVPEDDHVGGLVQGRNHPRLEIRGVGPDLSLVDHALAVFVQVLDRILQRHDVGRAV